MTTIVSAEHLSKTYVIAHKARRKAESFREAIEIGARTAIRRLTSPKAVEADSQPDYTESVETLYALKDVSFDIKLGERVGIIGANGAGKSTLLKILSRTTEPTTGRVRLRGRVSSLLEVGTGFHPELTGRENIFLNGAILGMPRSEIKQKFDEIVAFSEVEKFLDTPVKRYSSGMYVRLAFSVAAHLDPEVLILDEVLAVGDFKFQQKCLAKMKYASDEGRTVLFVSHNMQAVTQICQRAILLTSGTIEKDGPSVDVVDAYFQHALSGETGLDVTRDRALFNPVRPIGDDQVCLVQAVIIGTDGVVRGQIGIHEGFTIAIHFEARSDAGLQVVPNLHIFTSDGIFAFSASPPSRVVERCKRGGYVAKCHVPPYFLNNGLFKLDVALTSFTKGQQVHCHVPAALSVFITDDYCEDGYRNGYAGAVPGIVRGRFNWDIGTQ